MNINPNDLIDAVGVAHHAVTPDDAVRIVCLVPSITELLCDLGLAPYLVGRTGYCIHPKHLVSSIAKIGGTKTVNQGKIKKLSPTHLIVNIDENEKPTVDALAEFIPNVIVTHPNSVYDNLAMFRLLGSIFSGIAGVHERALVLCGELEQALHAVTPDTQVKRVLYCIWKDPWMTVSNDTYIARFLALRGWQSWQSTSSTARYPSFEWNAQTEAEIDVVLLSTEPYSFTQAHVEELQTQIGKPVKLVDGEMLSWYGSRAIRGLSYLTGLKF